VPIEGISDAVPARMPDKLWDGAEHETRAYKVLKRTCHFAEYPAPLPQPSYDILKSKGFYYLDMERDDHVLAAYFHVAFVERSTFRFNLLKVFMQYYEEFTDKMVSYLLFRNEPIYISIATC
jgi:hypothetical protein